MDDVVAAAMGPSRLALIVLAAFGAFSILLAGLGVYGSSSYAVVQETRQIAIRMALGERPAETRRRVLVRGLRSVGLGLALGMLGAMALSRLASASLRKVEPGDPLTYALTALILAAIGLLAAWVPAERATRVDPLRSLREA